MITSIIICFSTTKEGWQKVAAGSLLKKPSGESEGRHACLAESYNLENSYITMKNSWGMRDMSDSSPTKDRFITRWNCLHSPHYIHVYFTSNSIKGKGYPIPMFRFSKKIPYPPDGVIFQSGDPIPKMECIFMNELAAIYTSEWWCFPVKNSPHESEGLTYIGFLVESWIQYCLNIKH